MLHEWTSQGASPNVTFVGSDVVLETPHATSSLWEFNHGRYDAELTGPDGDVARLDGGWVIVDREVTR